MNWHRIKYGLITKVDLSYNFSWIILLLNDFRIKSNVSKKRTSTLFVYALTRREFKEFQLKWNHFQGNNALFCPRAFYQNNNSIAMPEYQDYIWNYYANTQYRWSPSSMKSAEKSNKYTNQSEKIQHYLYRNEVRQLLLKIILEQYSKKTYKKNYNISRLNICDDRSVWDNFKTFCLVTRPNFK